MYVVTVAKVHDDESITSMAWYLDGDPTEHITAMFGRPPQNEILVGPEQVHQIMEIAHVETEN